MAAQVRIGEIDTLGMLGRYDDAIALADAIRPRLAPRDAARVLGNVGSLHLRQDRYDRALACYDEARALLPADAEPRLRAGLAVNAGIALTYLGREPEATQRYTEARGLYADLGSAFEVAVMETNLAFLEGTAGRYAAALALLTRALPVFEADTHAHERARALIDAGETCRALNLLPEAAEHFQEAQRIFLHRPLDYDRARASLGQAAILAQQGQDDAAETCLAEAEALFVAQSNSVQRAHVRLLRALLRQRQGQEEAARQEARAAEAAFRAASLPGWVAEAQLAQSPDDPTTLQSIVAAAQATGKTWLHARAERAYGLHARARGDRVAALAHLRQSVAALESLRVGIAPEELHVAFLSDKEGVYGELAALLLADTPSEAEVEEALLVTERSRSRLLLERVLAALERLPESETTTESVARLRAELSRAYRETLPRDPSEPQRHGLLFTDLLPLESAYAHALRQSERYQFLPSLTLQGALPGVKALQSALGDDETLLVYACFGEYLGAFVVERTRLTPFPRLARLTDLQHAARRFRYHLQIMAGEPALRQHLARALKGELDGVLRRLCQLVYQPLAHALRTERLVVIPAGPLHGLPFAAFQDDQGTLVERHELVVSPSAAIWHALTQRRPPAPRTGPALVVGLAGIGTEQVGNEVAAVVPCLTDVTCLEGPAATLDAVRTKAAGKAVLHFASHALFRVDNPLFSGLQLADGWLLARDLYGLRLEADLVTLSACQTAVAEIAAGDEPFGLVRGFLAAGARQVAASLWPADDAATATLMQGFYQGLAQGQSPAAALRCAQRVRQHEGAHPYYWAAFCLIGSR